MWCLGPCCSGGCSAPRPAHEGGAGAWGAPHGLVHPHKCLIVQFHNSWGWPQKWHRGTAVVQPVGQRTPRMPMKRGGFHGHVCHPVKLGPPKRGLRANLGPPLPAWHLPAPQGLQLENRQRWGPGGSEHAFTQAIFPKESKKIAFKAPNPRPRPKKLQLLPLHPPNGAKSAFFTVFGLFGGEKTEF